MDVEPIHMHLMQTHLVHSQLHGPCMCMLHALQVHLDALELDGACADAIATLLHAPRLRVLTLAGNQLNEAAMKHIASRLHMHPSMATLALNDQLCGTISMSATKELLESMETVPTLVKLRLGTVHDMALRRRHATLESMHAGMLPSEVEAINTALFGSSGLDTLSSTASSKAPAMPQSPSHQRIYKKPSSLSPIRAAERSTGNAAQQAVRLAVSLAARPAGLLHTSNSVSDFPGRPSTLGPAQVHRLGAHDRAVGLHRSRSSGRQTASVVVESSADSPWPSFYRALPGEPSAAWPGVWAASWPGRSDVVHPCGSSPRAAASREKRTPPYAYSRPNSQMRQLAPIVSDSQSTPILLRPPDQARLRLAERLAEGRSPIKTSSRPINALGLA